MTRNSQDALAKQGRFAAFLIAGTGIAWLLVLALGGSLGWSQRVLALFDLAAMACFAMALWLLFGVWRARRNNKE